MQFKRKIHWQKREVQGSHPTKGKETVANKKKEPHTSVDEIKCCIQN